ncbi:MAG: B12-binding domain-containing radical SAM protein [Ardenticatenaceae bacterium]|nr:B12-binding domain-containing radical SAM protein [Ardenticatenaceae bacterium]
MSTVLFGQSYYLRFDPKLWAAMQPYPPLGTLYAAAYVRSKGYDVALFDAMLAESEVAWAAALDQHRPEFAVIFEDNFNYLSKMCLLRMRQAAFTMSAMARERGCTVIVSGADATDHAAEYLAQGADYILVGEGEITLGELLDSLTGRSSRPVHEVLGLTFPVAGSGWQVEDSSPATRPSTFNLHPSDLPTFNTGRRPDIRDLDALPFPAWDLVDIGHYQRMWRERHGSYSMNMVTTRGCPYQCNWCAKPIWGQRHNVRSPENVVAELKWLKETYHPDHIWFADDIMGLKPGWIQTFADLVEKNGARLPFKSLSRVDLLLRGDTIDALKRAGCQSVWVGAESGSQKILDAMEKGTTVEQIYAAARRLHEAGIKVGFFLQFGYPGETREDIEKTLQMVRDCQPDDVGMSVSYPLPGTRFFENVKAELGLKQNWYDSNDLAMLYRGPFTTAFYRKLHTVLHKEFRARKLRDELRRTMRQPATLRRGHLRQVAAMLYHLATLPLERWHLDRLAAVPHAGLGPLPAAMAPTAAARPTPRAD